MSEEAKVYTCSVCGKPTPNYHEWSPSVAAILGEQGSSTCDECLRKAQISYKWKNEQFAEERLICPYCEISIISAVDLASPPSTLRPTETSGTGLWAP